MIGTKENDIFYWLGIAYEGLGKVEPSQRYLHKATIGSDELEMALYYNDPQPDKIFYQGCSWLKLGEEDKAEAIFHRLIHYGESHLNDDIKLDYFAVSLPDLLIFESNLSEKNKINCQYLSALGYMGFEELDTAIGLFKKILLKDASHHGAKMHLELIVKNQNVKYAKKQSYLKN